MKIGLIGWYNHYNYGDDRILYCLKKFFSGCNFLITNSWQDARLKINELNNCDYILIGGGGFILRDCWRHIDVVLNFKKPFGLVGIGVEAKHKSMEQFLKAIKEKAEFILVRDSESKRKLEDHYKVIVGPDLTFLFPFDIVPEIKEDICGVNLRDWYYWKSEFFGTFYSVMKRIDNRFPIIKKIYPFVKWDPEKAVEIIQKNFKHILALPLSFSKDYVSDVDILKQHFGNVPSQIDLSIYDKIRYLVGMRLHFLIFSMQFGVPFISLSYQPKNFSFCANNNLNILSCDIYNLEKLKNKIDFVKTNYNSVREKIIFQREKNIKDINYIFKSIFNLINTRQ